MSEQLVATLEATARLLQDTRHDWWVIAGAAAAIHGVDTIPVADVDVLIDERDAATVFTAPGVIAHAPNGDDRFRSVHFARWDDAPLPVELMSGFRVLTGEDWVPIRPASRDARTIGNEIVYVPSRNDLRAMLRAFGRPKDLLRARRLEALNAT